MHPVISSVTERYEAVITHSENTADVLIMIKKFHEWIIVHFNCDGDDEDEVLLRVRTKIRYPLSGVRHAKYFNHLSKKLSELDFGLKVLSPRSVEITARLGRDSMADFTDWENASGDVDYYVGILTSLSYSILLVSHVNHRLSERRGTESYRKLLPSRLAELTICGTFYSAGLN